MVKRKPSQNWRILLRIVMLVYDVHEFAQIPAEILESYGYGNVLVDHPYVHMVSWIFTHPPMWATNSDKGHLRVGWSESYVLLLFVDTRVSGGSKTCSLNMDLNARGCSNMCFKGTPTENPPSCPGALKLWSERSGYAQQQRRCTEIFLKIDAGSFYF